ncbi:F-box protein At5g49610-like [Cornus florida]|uniref:F-box protein At5g49610-like n=1 Tax=Cornus florida TaxID=4283 RepID=UPI00289EDC40|nr:F-box protein At5g49610-like [Cornus florida]
MERHRKSRKRATLRHSSNITNEGSTARGHQNQRKQKPTTTLLDLPCAIVMDILSGLSTTTLISCRCVCKTWFNLLSDPLFTKIRLARPDVKDVVFRANGSTYLLELEDDSNFVHRPHRPLKINPGFDHLKLIGSCNGLLCFSDRFSRETLYICNPILGECVRVPKRERLKQDPSQPIGDLHVWI